MTGQTYHIPALLETTVDALDVRPGGVYADATYGGGGHSREILRRLGEGGRLYGFDQDLDALANAADDPRFTFVHGNFRYMRNFLVYYGEKRIDGIVADLGVSFHHFDDGDRGFSFRTDAPLDMRMNRKGETTAAQIVNQSDEDELTAMLQSYTDLKRPRLIARAIVKARAEAPVDTTGRLAAVTEPVLDPRRVKKDMAQVFQALRITVNGEMDALREFLLSTPRILRQGGRLAILTYHSVEDRMVKNFFRTGDPMKSDAEKDLYGNILTPWRPVIRGAVTAGEEEVLNNPRARSARLRAAELVKMPRS